MEIKCMLYKKCEICLHVLQIDISVSEQDMLRRLCVAVKIVLIIYYQIWSIICHIDSYSRGATSALLISVLSVLVLNYARPFQGGRQMANGKWDKVGE